MMSDDGLKAWRFEKSETSGDARRPGMSPVGALTPPGLSVQCPPPSASVDNSLLTTWQKSLATSVEVTDLIQVFNPAR